MDRSPADTMEVDAFRMRLIDIHEVEVTQLHALSISVGWPHRALDWQLLLDLGQGVAALDDIGRVTASAMWFAYGEAFANIGMVITSPRLQSLGAGQWLMERIMADSAHRSYRLNATRAARRLYQSLDFKRERTVYQCQGEARQVAAVSGVPTSGELRALDASDLDAATALDQEAFGVARPELLARLWSLSSGTGVFRNGRLAAFALCRPFGRGYVVGPIVATQDSDAVAVLTPHVAAHAGRFLRVDTNRVTGPFADFLGKHGLPVFDTVQTMSRGGRPHEPDGRDGGAPSTYGLVSQAFG